MDTLLFLFTVQTYEYQSHLSSLEFRDVFTSDGMVLHKLQYYPLIANTFVHYATNLSYLLPIFMYYFSYL